MAHLAKAIDEVRAQEAKTLTVNDYEAILTKTRWLLLKRPKDPHINRKPNWRIFCGTAWGRSGLTLLKEELQHFWLYTSPYWAGQFLDKWCTNTMRSKIESMKKVAKMLRRHRHRPLLLNWFLAKNQFSIGNVEGFNTKAKLTTRYAFGFRTHRGAGSALYHALAALPAQNTTHEFFWLGVFIQRTLY